MSHWASDGFDLPGGVDKEEYDAIFSSKGAVEGMIYRVISRPNDARARRAFHGARARERRCAFA